jgi:LysM repeat protein
MRRPVIKIEIKKAAVSDYDNHPEMTMGKIAEKHGISESTIYKYMQETQGTNE